jgi:hypothetical protein
MLRRVSTSGERRLATVALLALVIAFVYLLQPSWDNERAHYDFTRALASGSPSVDESFAHPALRTIDVVRFHGHVYAAKAPGLAAVAVPPYLALRAFGAHTTGPPRRLVWTLHLWAVVIPAVLLLVLVRRRVDELEPGYGTIAAVALGTATLILPFSTLLFSHVLSATLGFCAFMLVVPRTGVASQGRAATAGLVAGLAFTVEYSLLLVAAVLGLLVLLGPNRLRRGLAYGLGALAGALPALAFNEWAFGSPFHVAYEGWHHAAARPLPGVFGITLPSIHNLLKILFYPGGIGPILVPAIVGSVLLWRRGRKVEAFVPLLVTLLFVVFDAANSTPFGGVSPGPRYVIPALPFLALPLAAALRRLPGATVGILAGGGLFMAAATLTTALEAWDGLVAHRVLTGQYVESVAAFIGIHAAFADLPFVLAIAVAVAAALAATPWEIAPARDVLAGAIAFCGWLLLSSHTQPLLGHGAAGEAAVLVVACLVAGLVAAVYRVRPLPHRVRLNPSEEP